MTLCIAAACRHEGQSAVVTCADWQITGPRLAAEDYYKQRHYPNATILFSGELGAIDDFSFDLHETIKQCNEIAKRDDDLEPRINQYLTLLRNAAKRRKRLRAEDRMAMTYGMSLKGFYQKGAKRFPKGTYKKIVDEIKTINLDVSAVIIYSGDNQLLMLRVGPWGGAGWERNYAAIGSGAGIAGTVLCQIPHNPEMPLPACLLRVLDAKVAAERDPFVGRSTSLGVVLEDGTRYDVSEAAWALLTEAAQAPSLPSISEQWQRVELLGQPLSQRDVSRARQTDDRWRSASSRGGAV